MNFIARNNKAYETVEEYQVRREQFNKTHAFIQEHNSNSDKNAHVAGHNKFSDWSEQEFKTLMGLNHYQMVQSSQG